MKPYSFPFVSLENKRMRSLLVVLFVLQLSICAQCQSLSQIHITSPTPVQINGKQIDQFSAGEYRFQCDFDYPVIMNLEYLNEQREIFWEPEKSLSIKISKDTIVFSGNLAKENQYLLSDKLLNEEVGNYLNQNWYTLHVLDSASFREKIDSIKQLYLSNLDADSNISSSFKLVNSASIHFAFDRMLLRYPMFHERFTGQKVILDENHIFSTRNMTEIEFWNLEAYKGFTRTYLDLKLATLTSEDLNSSQIYFGRKFIIAALELITKTFADKDLRDRWSFEYIKANIDQHTWINGVDLVDQLLEEATSEKLRKEIALYKEGKLEERKDLETIVYKNAQGYLLETYICRPENFDSTKTYPALAAFHGGGWTIGDASFSLSDAKHAAANGMIGFTVEYRLSNNHDITPLEASEDVADFFRWLRRNADDYAIDPDMIIAKGTSAGGHLVTYVSTHESDDSAIPNALILTSPALDTSDEYFKSLLNGGQSAEKLSPTINLIEKSKIPPTLILQGKTDNVTPTKFAQVFDEKMASLGKQCELVIYDGCGHLFTPSHLDDTGWPQPDPDISKKARIRVGQFYKELGFIE